MVRKLFCLFLFFFPFFGSVRGRCCALLCSEFTPFSVLWDDSGSACEIMKYK